MTLPSARPLQPGECFGATEILELVHQDRLLKQYRYRVKYICCGRESELLHYAVKERARKGVSRCNSCHRKHAADQLVARNLAAAEAALALNPEQPKPLARRALFALKYRDPAEQPKPLEPPPGAIPDHLGRYWSPLGKLGPRWASGTTKPNQIGTGAEKR